MPPARFVYLFIVFLPSLQIVYDADKHNGNTVVRVAHYHHKTFLSTLYFLYSDQLPSKNEGSSYSLNYTDFVFNGNAQHQIDYTYCRLTQIH